MQFRCCVAFVSQATACKGMYTGVEGRYKQDGGHAAEKNSRLPAFLSRENSKHRFYSVKIHVILLDARHPSRKSKQTPQKEKENQDSLGRMKKVLKFIHKMCVAAWFDI